MDFIDKLKQKVKQKGEMKVVYPDGEVETCVQAASFLCKDGLLTPVLLGNEEKIKSTAKNLGVNIDCAQIIDPKKAVNDDFIETYHELRKHKGCDKDEAKKRLEQVHYYGAMMVEKNQVVGMVGGLTSETKPFIPAFHIVRTKPGIERASSAFFMVKDEHVMVYSDCAMNINPDAKTLAEIGVSSGDTAKAFGIEPKIAFLSFSTNGTAEDALVDKVSEATAKAKELRPDYMIDGEMQFDAAILPNVAKKKWPESKVAGQANVLIFPDLNAGNIGYKITERLGGYAAVGPIFQGLNKPVNDLSRGSKPEDIAKSGYLTAVQSMID